MSAQLLTVTAIKGYGPATTSLWPMPTAAAGGPPPPLPTPDDLIVISADRVNHMFPSLLTAAMALGMVISDWSLHLPWEYRLICTRNRWKLSHLAYFAARLGGVAYSLAAVLGYFVGNTDPGDVSLGPDRWNHADELCRVQKKLANLFAAISIGGSTAILLLRCLALWRFKLPVVIPLVLLWLATPVLLLVNIANLPNVSRRNGISVCAFKPPQLKAKPLLSYMPWFLVPVFDSAILILSLVGLHRATSRRGTSPLERMFRLDNIFYYIATLITVLPIPIWYLVQGRDGRMMPYLNVYIGLSSVLSCRIFINLWKAIGKELALAQTFDPSDSRQTATGAGTGAGGGRAMSFATGTPTTELRRERSMPSRAGAGEEEEEEIAPPGLDYHSAEVELAHAGGDSSSKEAGFTSSGDSETKNQPGQVVHHRVVPDWADVDPDLAFRIDGVRMVDQYADRDRTLRSSPT